jgi:hypothetical protein
MACSPRCLIVGYNLHGSREKGSELCVEVAEIQSCSSPSSLRDHLLFLHVCKLQCGFRWILDDEDFTAGRIIRVAGTDPCAQ